MAEGRAALTGKEQPIPRGYRWADLASPQMEGVKLEQHYRDTLAKLGGLHECDVHTQDQAHDPRRPRRVRRVLQARPAAEFG
jgi:hypothetical protein